MSRLFRFDTARKRHPEVTAWMRAHPGPLGDLARKWFQALRACGNDVREVLHNGQPTACVGDAAFAYVDAFRAHVNVGFFRGSTLADPHGLLQGTGRSMRHVKLAPAREVDEAALRALVRAAYADMKTQAAGEDTRDAAVQAPRLLAGGNPQIPMGEGDTPVQAYIAAMPGRKQAVARDLDALVARTVPGVRKAVKWNSPFYGLPGQGWFLSFHCFTRYVKVTFFRGAALRPLPPGASRTEDVRYLDIHEHDAVDDPRLAGWIAQASRLPGWQKT